MEKKGGTNYDPGWNDPPMFSYESQSGQLKTAKPRTLLNKRVAFPLNEASPPSANSVFRDPTSPLPSCNFSSLPPPPSAALQPTNRGTVQAKEENAGSDDVFNPSLLLDTVMHNFSILLNAKFENEGKDKSDIQRRLDSMKKMWTENKLCKDIQLKLGELSEALIKGEIEKADHLQKVLMVDHGSACSLWMSGVRHLIHHKPQTSENYTEEQEETN